MGMLLVETVGQVARLFGEVWPYLLLSALIATALKLYVDMGKAEAFLRRHRRAAVFSATGIAVSTPLCSCGTMAVMLGMLASRLPWAPIVAFMVASPLSSPQQLLYSAGLFGWPFALALFSSSILFGLTGGFAAMGLEHAGWLADQARFRPIAGGSASGSRTTSLPVVQVAAPRAGPRVFAIEAAIASRRLLAFFLGFAFLGYLLNNLVPQAWVSTLFGSATSAGVPLAATLGLPLYLNTEASLPLVRAFMENGASPGAALAFLITGAGTSLGAFTGALTIARWRVVALVVATLWVGAIATGYAFNAILAIGK